MLYDPYEILELLVKGASWLWLVFRLMADGLACGCLWTGIFFSMPI